MSGLVSQRPHRVAVLTSGNGTNMEAVVRYSREHPDCPYTVTRVLADRPCKALERAAGYGIPTVGLDRHADSFQQQLLAALKEADFIVLAGFLSILGPDLIEAFPGRILNIHPSLLPRHGGLGMHGRHVHEAVLSHGDPESGCSAHLVTSEVDAGEILVQKRVPVLAGDTPEDLARRILPLEHVTLVEGLLEAIARAEKKGQAEQPGVLG